MQLCENPLPMHGSLYPCGTCEPCRVKKKREWTTRILLEASQHKQNCFVTLTYSDDKLPPLGSLEPDHLKYFWMRLRKALYPQRFRYYAVGEYGDKSLRPHYHAAIFSFQTCLYGRTQHQKIKRRGYCCPPCKIIFDAWGFGGVDLAQVEPASAAYVTGYVIKKMVHRHDERLNGRYPEFSRSSRRPGIGADYAPEIASAFLQLPNSDTLPDVPTVLRHGGRRLPLGRYLTRLTRKHAGRDPNTPQVLNDKRLKEVRQLREIARSHSEDGTIKDERYKTLILEMNNPAFQRLMNRKLYAKKRGTL